MAFLKITHIARESRIATNIAMATLSLRLITLMHIANIIFAPSAKGHILPGEFQRGHSNQGIALTTGLPRGRCRCQGKISRKDLSQPKENPGPRSLGNSHEDLQWLLRQSAMLSHNQNVDVTSKAKSVLSLSEGDLARKEQIRNAFPKGHNGRGDRESVIGGAGEGYNDRQLGEDLAAHIGKRLQRTFRKEFTDEHSWRQFIEYLEVQWAMRWGECGIVICDLKSCRRKVLRVACVGPCTKYRDKECPEIDKNICATSVSECPSSSSCLHGNCNEHYGRESSEQEIRHESQQDNEKHESDPIDEGRNGHLNVHQNIKERENVTALNIHPANIMKKTQIELTEIGANISRHTVLIIPSENEAKNISVEPEGDDSTKRSISRSQQITSGIRYLWVVSCIVVPTVVFCVGYAIAMHLRHKRYLHRAQCPAGTPRGPCNPILTLPPYSTEDLFTCPPRSVPDLSLPPPSYEYAMSEPASPASRNRTITECSAFSQEPLMSENTTRPVSPPPYEDIVTEPSSGRRGHHRLPSYDSVICLHTSI